MTKHLLLLTCAVGAISSGVGVAAAAAADTTSPSATEVGAVIVTAEKRQQNLQKVPVAVTAFTTKQRDLVGIENLQDMTNFTPGLVYSSVLDRVTLRGVGRQTNLLSADAAVTTYVDGFFTTSAVEASKPPMFVSNIEVLRGPQGTLQGRNAIGGALRSPRPTRPAPPMRRPGSRWATTATIGHRSLCHRPTRRRTEFPPAGLYDQPGPRLFHERGWRTIRRQRPGSVVHRALGQRQAGRSCRPLCQGLRGRLEQPRRSGCAVELHDGQFRLPIERRRPCFNFNPGAAFTTQEFVGRLTGPSGSFNHQQPNANGHSRFCFNGSANGEAS